MTKKKSRSMDMISIKWLGGEGGIRTHGELSPTHDFQSCPIGHSGTSPWVDLLYSAEPNCPVSGTGVALRWTRPRARAGAREVPRQRPAGGRSCDRACPVIGRPKEQANRLSSVASRTQRITGLVEGGSTALHPHRTVRGSTRRSNLSRDETT